MGDHLVCCSSQPYLPWPPRTWYIHGQGHKVPGFNWRDLNCCLTLKFCVCIESYVQLAKIKKKNQKVFKNDREIKFLKQFRKSQKSRICPPFSQNSIFWALFFFHHGNVRHLAKIQYFELYFLANILVFIVLIDSTKITLGYRKKPWQSSSVVISLGGQKGMESPVGSTRA